jgi:pheromone-response scaffold protein
LLDQSKKSSIVDDVATIGTLQSYVGEDGYRRLPTGVSPRFYEGTINSLIFQEKPSKAIIIINQSKLIRSSMSPVRNMIKSLSMIGIEILLLLCSTSTLSENSNVIDSYELGKKELRRKEEELMETIERYENFLKMTAENGNGTAVCLSSGMCVGDKVRDYIVHAPQDMDLNEILNITVSNTSLRNFKDPMTSNKIFIEVGLDSRQKTNSSDVVDLAGWEDIMEVVCVYCGLEFDESDFYVSTDDELTDDSQSCDSGNSFLRDS